MFPLTNEIFKFIFSKKCNLGCHLCQDYFVSVVLWQKLMLIRIWLHVALLYMWYYYTIKNVSEQLSASIAWNCTKFNIIGLNIRQKHWYNLCVYNLQGSVAMSFPPLPLTIFVLVRSSQLLHGLMSKNNYKKQHSFSLCACSSLWRDGAQFFLSIQIHVLQPDFKSIT